MSDINIINYLKGTECVLSRNSQNSITESTGFLECFSVTLEQESDYGLELDIPAENIPRLNEAIGISIIEMQELNQNGLLFNDLQDIISNNFISSHSITFETPIENINFDDLDIVEELTLKVSSQPWIISPNLDKYETLENYGYNIEEIQNNFNTNFLVTSDGKRFADQDLFESINNSFNSNQNDISQNLNINQLELKQCEYIISGQIIQECSAHEFKLQDHIVDNQGISKYDALSHAVKKQIINSIAIQKIHGKNTIEISLHPKNLGNVKIKCDIHDNIAINISVEKLTTLALLQQNANEIKEVLLKNLNDNLSADLSFNMRNSSKDHDQKSTHNKHIVDQTNNYKLQEVPNALMYFLHDGKINFIV